MRESWKTLEGQIVDGQFPLQKYLGGTDDRAVFLTERGRKKPQPAAIKLVAENASHDGDAQLQRWRMAERLSHPHLMHLFESGRCQFDQLHAIYVVMEYAEEDLGQVLPSRALSATEAGDILEPALSALAYLHAQGFVHGHLKPANFMAVDAQLRLSCDGVCQIGDCRSDRTGVYAPPEVLSEGLSPAGDVWSLGVTLCEALTQQLPIINGGRKEDPALPGTIPSPLLEIVQNCLRWDVRRRWSVDDIRKLLQGQPPPPAKAPERPPDSSRKWIYGLTAALALVLLGVAIAPWTGNPRPEPPRAPSVLLEAPRTPSKPVDEKQPEVAGAVPPASTTPETPAPAPSAPPDPAPAADKPSPLASAREPAKQPPPPSRPAAVTEAAVSAGEGEIVRQAMPRPMERATRTIHGKVTVSVRVRVDAAGNVVDASFESPGPSQYFRDLAMAAARQWKFAPTQDAGAREWLLLFHFFKSETNVIPSRVRS